MPLISLDPTAILRFFSLPLPSFAGAVLSFDLVGSWDMGIVVWVGLSYILG